MCRVGEPTKCWKRWGRERSALEAHRGYEEIVQRSPGRWDIPITPLEFGLDDRELPWWPLVAEVLGANAEPSFSGVVFSDPGSPAQRWHADSPHIASEHRRAHALAVLVALQDIPLEMGPTECARGSHFPHESPQQPVPGA